jgi:valyl-tRNA synthetase
MTDSPSQTDSPKLDKTFSPGPIEAKWYAHWEASGAFRPERPDAEPFTIVIPPPNVTGSLHIGHALDNTLQDILVRYHRLRGHDALWVVGTDHAGIATQMVVERLLDAEGTRRTDLGRDEFEKRVWKWKEESGGQITRQLRRLGASCDWGNERFTMDPGFSKAVTRVFVQLYRDGLLYRDKRLVNWDPKLRTAISDLEVETREVQGHFWHIRYPLEDGSGHITVATTRPETMLADMGVAVHPDDERYKGWVGKHVRLPITGRLIPIIADEHADPELGSGAVKITPGHDFNDFEVGRRAGIQPSAMLNMLDAEARVIQTADGLIPEEFLGVDRSEAREAVVARLEAEGVLERVEDRVIPTPYGDRSGVVIEPWLTDQWYVDAKTLAGPAIDAVRSGETRFVPETWAKTYFQWMENIQPWCVSRQLWWGHRIPAWYGPGIVEQDGSRVLSRSAGDAIVFVAETEAEACAEASRYYQGIEYNGFRINEDIAAKHGFQDDDGAIVLSHETDVLDTWFSSALWPFGTLGWPDETPELARYYPTSVLVTGFDIIFFWVARMMMQGMQFMKDGEGRGVPPFHTVYCHGLVRDAAGQKMSKSKGNTVDPLQLIDRYGADALRFTLAAMESQGRDIKLSEPRIEGYRNFGTKLWNAARFCQTNGIGGSTTLEPPAANLTVNRWIIAETVETIQALELALAAYRFDEAASTIYQFVWSRFCDWYIELIKPVLSGGEGLPSSVRAEPVEAPSFSAEEGSTALRQAQGEPGEARNEREETRQVAGWVLDQILVMLHPFMPFITEELWHALAERPYDLILAKWPIADARALDPDAKAEIDWLIRLISDIRSIRTDYNIPASKTVGLHFASGDTEGRTRLFGYASQLLRLARVAASQMSPPDMSPYGDGTRHFEETNVSLAQGTKIQFTSGEHTYMMDVGEDVDLAAERARLEKNRAAAEKERDALAKRLANPAFVEKAKPEAVEKARDDHAAKEAEAERLAAALARLG